MPPIPHERPCCPSVPAARPLPDPAAVRLCLIPDSGPPYDPGFTPVASAAGLPGTQPSPSSQAAGPPPSPAASQAAVPGHRAPGPADREPRPADRLPTEPGGSRAPEPEWPGRFAQVLAETLAGSRPARQLVPWTTERARDHIQRLGPHLTSSERPRVRRVVTSCPAVDVMEMCVVVGFGARVRALAIRLERSGQSAGLGSPPDGTRWLCTAVEAA